MANASYYQILGLQTGATTSDIKRRYRILAKQYHPDNNGDTKIMARINDAYKVLADPKSRYKYDQTLQTAIVRTPRPSKPVPTQPQQQHVTYTDDAPYEATRFPFWKVGLVGGVCAVIAIIGIIASLGHQKTPQLATTNVSHKQSGALQPQPTSTPTIPNSASLNGQLAQEEAKLKQEEALANAYEQQAQQALAHSRLDDQNAQNLGQQPIYSTTAAQPVSAPDSYPSLQAMRDGTLKGMYHYAVSYVSADGTETNLGPTSFGISIYDQKVHVSNIPSSSNSAATQVKLYRTLGNGSATGAYYLVATLTNGTTSYYDNTPDKALPTWTVKYE